MLSDTAHLYLWIGFTISLLVMLFIDLFVLNKKPHEITTREAAIQSVGWIALSVILGVGIWFLLGANYGAQYFTGYIIEKSLSVDNIFVWGLVLGFFGIPKKYRHKILFWGIFGALVMRAIFIVGGVALINQFEIIVPLLGLVLIWSAIKIFKSDDDEMYDVKESRAYKLFTKYIPTSKKLDGEKFFTRTKKGALVATPLFICLLVIEVTDLIFAVDSVPAILAIATDPFIIFASNAMAILGLRSLFFLFDAIKDKFEYLGTGVALVLGFIGVKMLLQSDFNFGLFALPGIHLPTLVSLSVVGTLLAGSVLLSLFKAKKES